MELLKHRLEEESRARATADSRILEVSYATFVYKLEGKATSNNPRGFLNI